MVDDTVILVPNVKKLFEKTISNNFLQISFLVQKLIEKAI